jgi:hypothetical protein
MLTSQRDVMMFRSLGAIGRLGYGCKSSVAASAEQHDESPPLTGLVNGAEADQAGTNLLRPNAAPP